MSSEWREKRVYVAGHTGLVGSAIVRRLSADGVEPLVRRRSELNLTSVGAVSSFFERERPEIVFLAAARVGGILANDKFPGDFIHDNLAIQLSVLEAARQHGVDKLLFLGSSCVYPRAAPQPLKEEYLLTGPLESTNKAYAIAKIAGLEMCRAYWNQYGCRFISVMPTNLYGPGDNFDLETSHVVPALIRKFHEAKRDEAAEVVVWGSGTPRREFMYVDDLADACVFLMERWECPHLVNVGVGRDISIAGLADIVREVVGFDGEVVYDRTKPDGTPRKLLDVTRLRSTGWKPRVDLREGIRTTYRWFLEACT